jgi:hypothetical protein
LGLPMLLFVKQAVKWYGGAHYVLCRGIRKVTGEIGLSFLAYNLKRAIKYDRNKGTYRGNPGRITSFFIKFYQKTRKAPEVRCFSRLKFQRFQTNCEKLGEYRCHSQ